MAGKTTAAAAGTIDIGGDLTVNRMGYGAMRITGAGIWGEPAGPGAGQGRAAPGPGTGGQLLRHRGLLRPGGQRDPDRRDLLPLPGGPGHRDQGRPDASRPGPLGAGRPPGAPPRGLRGQPAAAPAGADPALPVPRAGPQGAAGRLDRRPGRAEGRGQDPARRGVELLPRADRRGPGDRPGGVGAEPLQRQRPLRPSRSWTCARRRISRSCPGRRSRRPRRSRGCSPPRSAWASASGRSRWPGCWPGPRRSCRSRVRLARARGGQHRRRRSRAHRRRSSTRSPTPSRG